MSEEKKVTTPDENTASAVTENEENEKKIAIADPENPLDNISMRNIESMMKASEQMVHTMQAMWESDMREYGVNENHMKEIYNFNEQNKEQMPEGLTDEEREGWNHLNGIDKLTDEDITRIFGEGHKIIGVDHSQTMDRIKDVAGDFFGWMTSLREYKQMNAGYMMLVENEEEKNIERLRNIAEVEEDEDKKATMLKSIDEYYHTKYLDFLAETQGDIVTHHIAKAFKDEKKIEYWINRTRDKLKQLKLSSTFILEISQFEKRFLEEKYHKCSNVLLLYFMRKIIYCDTHNKKSVDRTQAVAMVFALDNCIRNQWNDEKKNRVFNNVRAFLDQIIDLIPEPKSEEE